MEEEKKTINIGEALADYITDLPYGTFVYYQDIERITKTRWGEQKYYAAIVKAKKILETRGKAIRNTGKGEYQVLYPGDYTGAYSREVRLANKRIRHGGKILKGAPKKDMSAEEIKSFNNVADFHTRLEARLRGEYIEVKALVGKKHPYQIAK